MKLALVHDYLNQLGGAERVVGTLHEIFPEAPIYTSIYDDRKLPSIFQEMEIKTSFMQYFPWISSLFRYYLLFYPLAFESFDLSEYEVILSSSSAWAKGVKKRADQLHICYCHNPMRFVWRYEDYIKQEPVPAWLKSFLPLLLAPIKKWDLQNSPRVDYFIANSRTVADRIKKIYQRESVIINPPVDCSFFKPSEQDQDYFLVVSRLSAYKRIDLVIEAFKRLDLPLKIIGEGPARKKLAAMAGENTEFIGKVSDDRLQQYLAGCRALIFPGEEDFGIVPLEAMACGRPVIAFKAGGALETMVEGETGLFFGSQTVESLVKTVENFQFRLFNKIIIREHAKKYDKEIFKLRIRDFVKERLNQRKNEKK
jgi:glycosyltransferase involved in cell wall biosynthesis